ncbi:MAG: uroporphyrinogen decarboxylase family protein [Oceanipulchritudo sp.]
MALIEPEFIELTEDLDPVAFWEENRQCREFTTNKPRCALQFAPDDHWLFEFLGVSSTLRYYRDKNHRDALHREANDITREYTGASFFSEDTWESEPRRIENLFDCHFRYEERGTPWLVPATDDPGEFARILDRAEATDMRDWALPEPYLEEWEHRKAEGKPLPKLGTGSRGPATVITSILAPEDAFFWMIDEPELMRRFSRILAEKMVEFNRFLREFSGNEEPGWWIADDNSALFNPSLYEEFCYPVLENVLDELAPPGSTRYHHSDSGMEHIIPFLKRLGITSVNLGPEIDVATIRRELPEAMILGHMPPFLLRNGSPDKIRRWVRSDFEKAGQGGGLTVATAGSLAAGTGVGRMRWFMQCVQKDCRY